MNPIVIAESMRIPDWVVDLDSFRRWAQSDEFPERGRFSHLKGELWVDPSMENLAHNKAKGAVWFGLGTVVDAGELGHLLQDGMLLTHAEAELSTEPDGMFFSHEALRSGRVRLEHGSASLEVEGSPEVVLEGVSPTSVRKDTVILRELYWKAGVREYWLVDPRGLGLSFDILRHTARGYVATRKQGGWLKSAVFGKSFRLTRQEDDRGYPRFKLEVR